MHASTEQLLSLRDDAPVDARLRRHVDDCPSCGAELKSLQFRRVSLQSLPDYRPPDDAWARIEAVASAPALSGSTRWLAGAAVAATTLVAALLLLVGRSHDLATPSVSNPPALADTTPGAMATTTRPDGADNPGVQEMAAQSASFEWTPETRNLVARSARLEQTLGALPERPRLVNAGTASTMAALEDRLAMIDYRLSISRTQPLSSAQAQRLWRQRVELMDSLLYLRYAQLQRQDF